MAKTSSVEKNEKRRRMVKQYAAKRKRLKAITQDKKMTMEERFTAQIEAFGHAAQLGQDPHPQPLRADRPAAGLLQEIETVASCSARTWPTRDDPWHGQVELVGRTDGQGDE